MTERILWVSLHLPHPTRGGGATNAFDLLVSAAAAGHGVRLLTGSWPEPDPGAIDALRAAGVSVEEVPGTEAPPPGSSLATLVAALRGPGPLGFQRVAPAVDALADVAARTHTDDEVTVVFAGEAAPVLGAVAGPRLLYVTDAYSRQLARQHRLATGRHRLLAALEHRQAERWERHWYNRADAVACVSEQEVAWLAARLTHPPDVLRNALAPSWTAPPARARVPDTVTFLGALDYRPNVDAVRYLLDDIWPEVLTRRPSARLRIVGRDPVPEVRAALAAAPDSVSIRADVADARDEYWEAACVVVPLRLGSGVKNKVLHAAACRAPLVGTPVAFEGTEVEPDTHALVADDAAGLADAIVATLADPDRAADRAERARGLTDRYQSAVVLAELEACLALARERHQLRSGPARP